MILQKRSEKNVKADKNIKGIQKLNWTTCRSANHGWEIWGYILLGGYNGKDPKRPPHTSINFMVSRVILQG